MDDESMEMITAFIMSIVLLIGGFVALFDGEGAEALILFGGAFIVTRSIDCKR